MKKPKRRNWGLREKRWKNDVALFDFPMQIRIKPTAHKQYCFLCRELTNKKQHQIVMASGLWCKFKGEKIRAVLVPSSAGTWLGSNKRLIIPRKIYLHTNCFSCLLKKMFLQAGIPVEPDCETCSKRFDCYTGNLGLDNQRIDDDGYYPPRPSYKPSRPCSQYSENENTES